MTRPHDRRAENAPRVLDPEDAGTNDWNATVSARAQNEAFVKAMKQAAERRRFGVKEAAPDSSAVKPLYAATHVPTASSSYIK